MSTYKMRKWDYYENQEVIVEMTFDQIVENPEGLYSNDISYALLKELRIQKGLSVELYENSPAEIFGEI